MSHKRRTFAPRAFIDRRGKVHKFPAELLPPGFVEWYETTPDLPKDLPEPVVARRVAVVPVGAVLSIADAGSNVVVTVAGGSPCFQYQQRSDLSPATPWVNVGGPTISRSKTLAKTGVQGYFRVQEQVVLQLDADLSNPNQTRLFWVLPATT